MLSMEKVIFLPNGQWNLEKGFTNANVPKNNCNCGAHSTSSPNMHYDWCDGLKPVKSVFPKHIIDFIDGLNRETKRRFSFDVGIHNPADEMNDSDGKNYFPTWKPGDIAIFNDHHSDEVPDENTNQELFEHLDDHYERINDYMDKAGYEPGSDYLDTGGGGGSVGSGMSHWTPKKK